MAKVRSWAGLDVHAAKVVAVTVDEESGELGSHRLSGKTAEVVAFCAALPAPVKVAYEAGPTASGSRGRWRRPGSHAWWRRPGRSRGPHRTGSRLTAATPSGWCGC